MGVIGKTVKSKATGQKGIITGIAGNKLSVSFDGHASISAQFVRRARKYNTCVRLATQEPRDFADDKILTHGKAIFNNSAYKLIFHLNKDAATDVAKLMTINENEYNQITQYKKTHALFVVGERRIPIRTVGTKKIG